MNNESDNDPDIFESDDVAKSCPVSYRAINQYGGTTCRPNFSRVNPDTIGCAWTGEFDLNTLRVDGEFLSPERKSCGFKNVRIRVGVALFLSHNLRIVVDYFLWFQVEKAKQMFLHNICMSLLSFSSLLFLRKLILKLLVKASFIPSP